MVVSAASRAVYNRVRGMHLAARGPAAFDASATALVCAITYANGGGVDDAAAVVDVVSGGTASPESRFACKLPPTGDLCFRARVQRRIPVEIILFTRHVTCAAGGWNSYANATCTAVSARGSLLPEGNPAVCDVVSPGLCH